MTDTLTLTTWTTVEAGTGFTWTWTAEPTREDVRRVLASSDYTVEAHATTYAVGDEVEVRAFGRFRSGVVVELKKTRVVVRFARNGSGETAERAFGAADVRKVEAPADEAPVAAPAAAVEAPAPTELDELVEKYRAQGEDYGTAYDFARRELANRRAASSPLVDAPVVEDAPAEVEAPAAPKHDTREAWLLAAVDALRPLFADEAATELPTVRVSVGWPGGRGKKATVIGQCWSTSAATDRVAQLFISPTLADASRVLDVLAHELVHAADDCQSGHGAPFARIAKAIGLTGKMTATVASEELKARLDGIAEELGAYPHAALSTGEGKAGEPKQTTRMLKVVCPEDGYTIRTTSKWLEVGLPSCPCGERMEQAL